MTVFFSLSLSLFSHLVGDKNLTEFKNWSTLFKMFYLFLFIIMGNASIGT